MIEENGRVISTDGDDAWVETSRRSSCGSCEAKGCGTGTLSQILGRKTQQMKVKNPIGAQPGDNVVLGLSESALIKGSLAVYLLPLLALLAGGLFGELMAAQMALPAEGTTAIFAILALGFSLLWLRRFNRHVADDERYSPVILRRETSATEKISFNIK